MTTEGSIPARAAAAGAAPRSVLAIHPGALGDVLQALPALAALRSLDGGRRVVVAAQPRLARLLVGAGAADAGLSFDGLGLEHLFADGEIPDEVRARLAAFDRVVSWFGARGEPFPARLRGLVRGAVVAPPVPDGPVAVWRHLLATVAPWGARAPDPLPVLAVPAAWRADAVRAMDRAGIARDRPVIVLQPGAGGVAKRWAPDKMGAVARRVAGPARAAILVHQGPADAEPAAALVAALAAGPEPIGAPLLVEPALEALAAVLAHAVAYLGSDSGVSHLAAAVGAPSVIVYAPGTRERWLPWGPRARAIDATPDGRDAEQATAALLSLALDIPGTPAGAADPDAFA
jgi:ADP-heptose:LPS heptosyltransferase